MPTQQGKITKLDLRIPNDLYAQILEKAKKEGAQINHRSGKPTLSPTVIRLIQKGIECEAQEQKKHSKPSVLDAENLVLSALEVVTATLIELKRTSNRPIILGGTIIGGRRNKEQIE